MPYEITVADDNSRIEVRYHGSVDMKQRLQALSDAVEILRNGQADKRLLIDVTAITSRLTTMEQFDFAEKLVATEEHRGARVAVIRNPGSDENQFINNVAVNRGYNLKEFTDRNEAIRWLQG
jgi:hypothetical protein